MFGFNPLIWFAIGLALMGLEIIVPGMILFWFGLSAVVTSLLVYLGILAIPETQWIFFFVFSIVLLLSWSFYFKRFFKFSNKDDYRDPTLTNLKGKVIEKIEPNMPGRVMLYENFHSVKEWKAEAGEVIGKGEEIEVIDSKGIVLLVRKMKEVN